METASAQNVLMLFEINGYYTFGIIKIKMKTELKNVSKLDDTSTSEATNQIKKDSIHVLSFFIFKT